MTIFRWCVGFLLVAFGAGTVEAADGHRHVQARGQAALMENDPKQALQNAIDDAKRNAVEQVATQAVAETSVGRIDLVRTALIREWRSYVHAFTLDTQRHIDDESLEVEIDAWINHRRIRADAKRFYRELPKPSVLVLVEVDGDTSLSTRAEKALQEFLAYKGCSVVDLDEQRSLLQHDTVRQGLRDGDVKLASSLGRRAGADVVMLAVGDVSRTETVRDLLFRSQASFTLTAIRADNSERLAHIHVSAQAIEGIRTDAPPKAIRVAARRASHELFTGFLVEWNRQLAEGWMTRAILSGVSDTEQVDRIAGELRELTELHGVAVEDYTDSVVTLGVRYMGDSQGLASYLRTHFDGGQLSVRIETIAPGEIFGFVERREEPQVTPMQSSVHPLTDAVQDALGEGE